MLILKEFINRGGTRNCWQHPSEKNLCVKINFKSKISYHEIHAYERVKSLIPGQVARIYPNLTETSQGMGFLCQLIRDETTEKISLNLANYIRAEDINEIENSLNRIVKRIIARDIFFFDFNLGNFIVQLLSNNSKKVWLIDIKSLNRTGYVGFLHLERIFAPLARIIMFRRLRKLYKDIGLIFPFNNLCRKKFFSTFFVSVK